jgi:flavin-dependent dehydrogenase
MAKRYDVIVVGAGLAGFLAAKAAGENGLEVALLEKNPDLTRRTRACGETLVSTSDYWMRNISGYNTRDKRIFFSFDGFSFKYDGPYQNIYGIRLYTPNGHKVVIGDLEEQRLKGDNGRVGISFDKEAMFKCLLDEVNACSVDVFPGINVQKVTSMADFVIAEGSGQSFTGRYLVAADGVNSRVARVMGMNEGRTYYCNLRALSYHMSGVESPEPNVVIRVFGFLKGRGVEIWVIPHAIEEIHNILLLNADPRVDLKAAGEYFMKEAYCAPWFKHARILRTFSAKESCYSPIIKPYKDRVLVTGDVGSTQEVENPGAMISGWRAGQAISTTVQQENIGLEVTGISEYADWWNETYVNYYDQDSYIKAFSHLLILTTEEEVNYVYGLIKETMPAAWHPFTITANLKQVMAHKVLPTIQHERPDIFQKLQRSSLPATKIYAEVARASKPVEL